jgi:hypothetical protein
MRQGAEPAALFLQVKSNDFPHDGISLVTITDQGVAEVYPPVLQ